MHPFRSLSHQRQDTNYNRTSKSKNSGPQISTKHSRKKDFSGSYYAYGKSAAIEFVCDETKKQKISTITLHAASARTDADRGYDWENKTIIQLPRHEMLVVTSILLGLRSGCEYRQTGAHSAKSYKVENQGNRVHFMVMEEGKPIRSVGLTPEDTYHIVSLFVRQLRENSPWMSVTEIIQMIQITVVNMTMADSTVSEEELDDQSAFGIEAQDEDDDDWSDDDYPEDLAEPNYNY